MFCYCIHNNINGKIYIGITTNYPTQRWIEHKSNAKINKNNSYFYNSINKYGFENFNIGWIDYSNQCDIEELKEIEIYFIEKYKTNNKKYGYNSTIGGDGGKRRPIYQATLNGIIIQEYNSIKEAEFKTGINKICNSLNGLAKSSGGFQWGYIEEKHKLSKYIDNISKPVVQYDKNCNFIAEFSSIKDAKEKTGISGIGSNCRNQLQSAGGFVWRYKGDPPVKYKTTLKREIEQWDPKTKKKIFSYTSIREASIKTNIDESSISKVCRKIMRSSGNYVWTFKGELPNFNIGKDKKKVKQFKLDGTLVKEYNSISEAFRETGIFKASIINCCKEKQKQTGGFKWKYV